MLAQVDRTGCSGLIHRFDRFGIDTRPQRHYYWAVLPISLNAGDVVKLFRDAGIRDKAAICEFLQEIANEATSLANLWAHAYSQVEENAYDSEGVQNLREYFRLSSYYRGASRVLANRLDEDRVATLFDGLGGILKNRELVRRAFSEWQRQRRLSPDRTPTRDEVLSLVEKLHEDAANLHVLVKSLQAAKT